MDLWLFWFLLLQSIIQYPQPVGDGLDEATRLRMEARAMRTEMERILLEREMEQLILRQSRGAWGDLLWSALQHWQAWGDLFWSALQHCQAWGDLLWSALQHCQAWGDLLWSALQHWQVWGDLFWSALQHWQVWGDLFWSALQHWQVWAVAGLLVLLLALWLIWRKWRLRREERQEENDGANEEEVRNVDANEEEDVGNEEDDANREEDNHDDGNVQEVGNEAANAENNNNNANAVDAGHDAEDNIGRIVMERIQWPVQDLQKGCEWTTDLMANLTIYFGHVLSNSFYPVLQRAIGVGSAFEGWSPREQDVLYCVLVPMTPPRGHSFHLELDTAGQRCVRNFHVRVQPECTCTREQQGENMLCFLHHPEEELRRNQDPSLLHTLCTGSYLDVHKTARWFYQLVKAIWPALPQSHNWHLVLLPSRCSCQFKVTNGRESFRIELLFGVRQGDSDIFVSSQPREAHTPSTIWPESYAVAEVKFFKYIARHAPPDSLHLKCLQFFTRLQLGFGFSTYTTKTIFMHLLNTLPVSRWRRRDFVRRLVDISEHLRLCLEARRLNHFILGNQRLPGEISLPPEVETAKTRNVFHHLVMDPVAHSQAMNEYVDLRKWFNRILNNEP